jgi:hypothetical protein
MVMCDRNIALGFLKASQTSQGTLVGICALTAAALLGGASERLLSSPTRTFDQSIKKTDGHHEDASASQ